jgi:hypothetical protein
VSSSSNSKNSLPILLLPPELFTFTFSEEVKKSSLLAPSLQNNQMLIPTPSGNTHIPVDSDDKDIEFIDVPLEIGENGGGNTVKLAYANLTDDGVMEAFKTEVEANKKGANKKKGESKNKSGDFTLNVDKVEFKVGLMKDKNTNVTITFGGKNVSAFVWNKGKGCQENRVADKIKKFVDGEKFKNSTVDLAKSYNPVTSDNVKNFCEDLSSTLLLLKNLPISSGVKLYLNLNSNFLLEITVTRKGEIYVLYFRAVNRTELTTTTNEMPDGKHKIICGFPISALETVMERKIKEVMADAGKKALDEEETQNNQPDDRDPDGPKDQDKKSNMSYSLSSVNSTDVGSSDSHENDDHLLNFLRLINEHDLRLMNEHEENNSQSSEKNNDDISSQSSEFSNHYSNYVKGQKEGDGVQDNISKDYSTTKSTTESDRDSTPTPPKGRKIYDSESDDD